MQLLGMVHFANEFLPEHIQARRLGYSLVLCDTALRSLGDALGPDETFIAQATAFPPSYLALPPMSAGRASAVSGNGLESTL